MADLFDSMDIKEEETGKSWESHRREVPKIFFVLLLLLYLAASVLIRIMSKTGGTMVKIGNGQLPMTAFAGVFTSIANACIIFLVVLYKRLGFYTSLVILLMQFPGIIAKMISQQDFSGLPGLFSNVFTIVVILLIYRRNVAIEKYRVLDIEHLREQQQYSQRLFEQTATALVSAIDAKDEYSHGHSLRVAEYSAKIARQLGKTDEECYRIYYTALLHDVGKIGIPEAIINKNGRLTDEEYAQIKIHATIGNQILSGISEYPYLSIGAHYHHERYDGKGYPEGLKGE